MGNNPMVGATVAVAVAVAESKKQTKSPEIIKNWNFSDKNKNTRFTKKRVFFYH